MRFVVFVFLAVGMCQSGPTEPVVCTMEARAALAVTVADARTGAPPPGFTRVVATDGSYADTLFAGRFDTAPALAGGAYERAGRYTVAVESEGYAPWRREGIRVRRDECHVLTQAVEARLTPLP